MLKSKLVYWLPLTSIILVCAVLLGIWAWIVPVFESPDENHHWKNAQYIHSHLGLPIYTPEYLEAPQAPLYYILVSPFATNMAPPPILKNPEVESALGFRFDNMPAITLSSACWPHVFANCPSDLHRYWPLRRARLATTLLGLVAVLFTGLAALELTKSMAVATMAAALVAFLPQFDFRAATVNNDPALVCFSAIATYFFIRMVMRGFERVPAVCCSIAIALAFLSKISAAVFVPIFAICILLTASTWRLRIKRCALLLGLSGVLVLPWLVRNEKLYGDLFGASNIAQTVPMMVNKRPITDVYFRTDFLNLTSRSFFGFFGWLKLKMPGFVYRGYAWLTVIAAVGLCFVLWKNRKYIRISLLLIAIAILSLSFLVYASLTYPQPQGRLLYQSLTAVAVLGALGFSAVPRLTRYVATAVVLLSFSIDAYALTRVVYPAYWSVQPTHITVEPDVISQTTDAELTPLLAHHSYSQPFHAAHNGLTAIDVKLARRTTDASDTAVSGQIRLSISEAESGARVGSVEFPAAKIGALQAYVRVDFAPVQHSAGKQYFVSVSVPEISTADPIVADIERTQASNSVGLYVDGQKTGQSLVFRTYYDQPCWVCP